MTHIVFNQSLTSLKRAAKKLRDTKKISQAQALNLLAKEKGFNSWALLAKQYNENTISSMDFLWKSLTDSQLVLLAAMPNVGKVSLAINMMLKAAKSKLNVTYLTTLSSVKEIHNKCLAVNSAIAQHLLTIPADQLSNKDAAHIEQSKKDMGQYSLNIIHDKSPDIRDIEKLLNEHKPEFFVLDYLQQINTENLQQDLLRLKKLTKQHACTILLVSQVNKDIPINKTLLTRHCDSVLVLHKPSCNGETNTTTPELHLLKSPMKTSSKIKLLFDPETGIFTW